MHIIWWLFGIYLWSRWFLLRLHYNRLMILTFFLSSLVFRKIFLEYICGEVWRAAGFRSVCYRTSITSSDCARKVQTSVGENWQSYPRQEEQNRSANLMPPPFTPHVPSDHSLGWSHLGLSYLDLSSSSLSLYSTK